MLAERNGSASLHPLSLLFLRCSSRSAAAAAVVEAVAAAASPLKL